ncbi:hypothetical protein FRC10_008527 [Ceratobasidium sp. 414]|nr:hypothetical protein FRC10_008527 [Ceratobasidium sp. 414]
MASVKLATLVIRTLAKPIGARLKHQAEQHETFRKICISWAQWAHRAEVRLRTNIMGETAKNIKPLSETRRRDDVDDQLDDLKTEVRELRSQMEAMGQGWEQALGDERSRNNELSRILTRVVEIGLRGGWAEIVDQAPLKIPASVVSHSELPDPRAGRGADGSLGELRDHDGTRDNETDGGHVWLQIAKGRARRVSYRAVTGFTRLQSCAFHVSTLLAYISIARWAGPTISTTTTPFLTEDASDTTALSYASTPFPGFPGSSGNLQNVIGAKTTKRGGTCHKPTGPIETTLCDFETVETMNNRLFGQLTDLVTTPFFKYFRADLYRDCPFWEDDGKCAMRECGVTSVDESEIPETWRAATLSKVQGLSEESRKSFPGCYYRDSDFCFLDDDTSSDGEYIDLTANPERFTGYTGPSAHKVWRTIYEENCFGLTESKQAGKLSGLGVPSSRPVEGVAVPPGLASGEENGRTWEAAGATSLEKRVYYRIISGLHASISTHICAENLNQQTGEWSPDLQCYIDRVASHPERLQNIYFNTVLLLRALRKVGPYLAAYDICSGNHEEEQRTRFLLYNVLDIASEAGKFDESALFKGADAKILREEFKDRFRNVTRVMDCIGCSKCRLWGKIQTTGVATALKILFEFDQATLDPRINPNLLQRTEVVALINTLHRFSESLNAVQVFQGMWEQEYGTPAKSTPSVPKQTASTALPRGTPVEPKPDFMSRIAEWCPACVKTWAEGVHDFVTGLMVEVEDLFSMSKDGIPRPDL